MKAAYIDQYGDAEQLKLGQLDTPKISESQVLISVKAAGVNPVDFHIRNGMFKDSGSHQLPLILGWDAAGVIAEVGRNVTHFKEGDQVFVFSPLGLQGAYAEFLAVDANVVVRKPQSLSFTESAAVPLAALTAWQGLMHEGQLKAGQRVLIHGASGGVGSFAVEIAKAMGAYVIGTASAKNEAYVRALGVDEFIDYQSTNFEHLISDMDLIFATVGGQDVVPRSLGVVKPGGRVVSTFDDLESGRAEALTVFFKRMVVTPSASDLATIGGLIDEGKITVTLDSVYPLEQVADAHLRSESRRAVGKIVLTL